MKTNLLKQHLKLMHQHLKMSYSDKEIFDTSKEF